MTDDGITSHVSTQGAHTLDSARILIYGRRLIYTERVYFSTRSGAAGGRADVALLVAASRTTGSPAMCIFQNLFRVRHGPLRRQYHVMVYNDPCGGSL